MKFKSDIEVQAGLKDSSGSAGTSGKILSSTGTGVAWVDDNPGISGTGTTNYISKFTGSTTLGNSLVYDNGTNVGIGTTSPGNKLSVVTGIGADDTIPALGYNGGKFSLLNNGGLYGLISGVLGNGHGYLQVQRVDGAATAYNMLLQPNGGNVGIGTTAPGAKLEVNGNIKYNGDIFPTTAGRASILNETPTSTNPNIVPSNSSLATGLGGDNGNLALIINSNPAVYVNSSSNVGIGTTSPAYKLDVNGTARISPTVKMLNGTNYNENIRMSPGTNDYSSITFGADPATDIGTRTGQWTLVRYPTAQSNIFSIRHSSTDSMVFTTGGNVGIGNTSPTEKLDVTGNVKATTFIGALSGNATTATTLQTARSISLGTAVTSTATNFNGSANITIPVTGVSEAYLTWGGKNFAGSYGPIDASLMPDLGANRLAFTAASAVIIEYSQDGGTTWLNYAVSDAVKINLLNGNSTTIQVGGGGYPAGTNYTNYRVRVTINTAGQIYTALNKFIILVSTNGSTGSYCTVDARTQSNYLAGINTWTTFANQTPVAGWSGYNVINTNNITTFGNTPASQFGQVRFTFGQTGYSATYTGLQIIKLLGFGGVGWQTPSTLAATGQMYTYDYLKNVYFQANLTAVNFIGALTGNATTATTLQTARTINGTSFNGSANITTANWGTARTINGTSIDGSTNYTTANWGTARTITIGNTGKSVNGSANVSWTLAEIGAQAALTNPVTGTGTTNYISKFTGSTTLGNSIVFDNGTNVGIGTTSPNRLLTVSGTTSGLIALNASSYRNTTIGSDSVGQFIVYDDTSGAYRMVINTSGNVGIGTTSPSSVLHLYRNSTTSPLDFSNSSSLILQNPYGSAGNTGTAIFFKSDVGTYNTFAGIGGNMVGSTGNGSYGDIVFGTKAAATDTAISERMRISYTGNVGIGTTSPNSTLSVGSSDAGAVITPGGGNTHLSLKAMGSQGELIFGAGGVSNGTAGTERMRIKASGNVGIGTTAPNGKLQIQDTNGGIFFDGTGATYNRFKSITSSASVGRDLLFSTQNSGTTPDLYITSTGNVGIGTSSPSTNLEVFGDSFSVAPSVKINHNLGLLDTSLELVADAFTGTKIITGGSYDTIFSTVYGGETMRIVGNGNVGIGNSSPNAKLDVAGDALINGLTIGQGPNVGQGNTAIGKGALASMVGGKFNIALGHNSNTDNDGTGLTAIGVSLNTNTELDPLDQDCLAISQFNTNASTNQVPHIYAPKPIPMPRYDTAIIIGFDIDHYAGAVVEYIIRLDDGSDYAMGTVYMGWKTSGSGNMKDARQIEFTDMSGFIFDTSSGSTLSLENTTGNDAWVRITVRGMMTN